MIEKAPEVIVDMQKRLKWYKENDADWLCYEDVMFYATNNQRVIDLAKPVENIAVEVIEKAIDYANRVMNATLPECEIDNVYNEILASSRTKEKGDIHFLFRFNEEIVLCALVIILCYDNMPDERASLIPAFCLMRGFIEHRYTDNDKVAMVPIWQELAKRVPYQKSPNPQDLQERINILEDELANYERFPQTVVTHTLCSMIDALSKDSNNTDKAKARLVSALTGFKISGLPAVMSDIKNKKRNLEKDKVKEMQNLLEEVGIKVDFSSTLVY